MNISKKICIYYLKYTLSLIASDTGVIAQNLGFQSTEGTGKNPPSADCRLDPVLLRFSVLPHLTIAGEKIQ